MRKSNIISLFVVLIALLTTSCKDTEILKPNVSGAAFEVLLVIDNDIYRTPAGEEIFNILNGDVPKLPQPEPQFDISRIEYAHFDQLFRTTRSIVFVVVDSTKYTKTTINFIDGRWAKTQCVVNITAANVEDLQEQLEKHGDKIINYLVEGERKRQMAYIKANIGQEALERAYTQFGCKLAVPMSFDQFKEGEDFLWMSHQSNTMQQNVVIYTVPYTSREQLTREGLLMIRDSVMKANIPGGMEGSYMGTEYKYDPPVYKTFRFRDSWCAEVRGLWRMVDGSPMGGPFVSHAHVDEVGGKILIIEGFVFAPAQNKRNGLRQMEAIIHSLKLPQHEAGITVSSK